MLLNHSSFFEVHKGGIIGIFELIKTEDKREIGISETILTYCTLDYFTFVFNWLSTVCKLLTLEVVRKRQQCQKHAFRKTGLTAFTKFGNMAESVLCN